MSGFKVASLRVSQVVLSCYGGLYVVAFYKKTLLLSCINPSFLHLGSKLSHLLLLLTKCLDPLMLHPHMILQKNMFINMHQILNH